MTSRQGQKGYGDLHEYKRYHKRRVSFVYNYIFGDNYFIAHYLFRQFKHAHDNARHLHFGCVRRIFGLVYGGKKL